eukprot:gene4606-5049_t
MVVVIVSSSLVALTTVVCARMYEVNYIKFGLYTFPYDLGLQITLANKKRRGSTTSKSRKSGFPSSILSSIMKHAFYRNSVLPITSTNSAENGHAHAVAVQAAQNFDMGLKGSKLADNSNVSPSAPPLVQGILSVVP